MRDPHLEVFSKISSEDVVFRFSWPASILLPRLAFRCSARRATRSFGSLSVEQYIEKLTSLCQ